MTMVALAGKVKGIVLDLAPSGITVDNVQPARTDTDVNAGHLEMLSDTTPIERVAKPE